MAPINLRQFLIAGGLKKFFDHNSFIEDVLVYCAEENTIYQLDSLKGLGASDKFMCQNN